MTPSVTDATTIRGWLDTARTATLCTVLDDARAPGTPFGSVIPYGLDPDGRPFVVISDLAVHTKNLKRDPRASLLIAEPGTDDVLSGWRVTLVGTMRPAAVAEPYLEALRAKNPKAHAAVSGADHGTLAGFQPWVLHVVTTRYIVGFGRMGWL